MSKFKPGDRVELVGSEPENWLPNGSRGKIRSIAGNVHTVEWDGFTRGHSGGRGDNSKNCWSVYENSLDRIRFKQGDRVRLTTEVDHYALLPGATGTVQSSSWHPEVKWDFLSTGWGEHGRSWGVDAAHLELLVADDVEELVDEAFARLTRAMEPKPDHAAADIALGEARRELERAMRKFGPFRSSHEGYAVILEELDELWDEVKANDADRAYVEATQVAAMALRFMIDVSAANVKNLAEAA